MKPAESGAISGGLLPKDPTGPHPVTVIDVPDIEEHVKKIESAGGKSVMPVVKVGEFGLYALGFQTQKTTLLGFGKH